MNTKWMAFLSLAFTMSGSINAAAQSNNKSYDDECQNQIEYCINNQATSCFNNESSFIVGDTSEELMSEYEREIIVEPFIDDLGLDISQKKLVDEWRVFVKNKNKQQLPLFDKFEKEDVGLFNQLEIESEIMEIDKEIMMGEIEFLSRFKSMLTLAQIEILTSKGVSLN